MKRPTLNVVMFQQYSHYLENASNTAPYAESSISGVSVPFFDGPILQAPATVHLHRSLRSSRDTSPYPIPDQPSPPPPSRPSPFASSTHSLSRPESRPKSLGNGHVASRGQNSDRSHSEKSSRHHHRQPPDGLNLTNARDPEKGLVGFAESPSRDSQRRCTTYTYTSDDMSRENACAEAHAVWILIYLSLLSPLLTLLIAFYTVLITPLLLLLAPLSLCTSHVSLSVKLHAFLSPPLNLQLSLIYSQTHISDPSNTSMLIPLNLLGPIYALGLALSAWVAAVFWFYAAILGDPEGEDGRDDGRAAVLGVSGWWERWLEKGERKTALEGD